MIKNLISIICTTSLLLLASCASETATTTKNPFDALTLKENLIAGKTTQTQILQTFGAPDIVTETNSKEDVWSYSQTKHESSGGNVGAGLLGWMPGPSAVLGDVWGSVRKDESSSKTVTLIVYFDKKKVLRNYSLNKVKL